jgi:hypothetical protein
MALTTRITAAVSGTQTAAKDMGTVSFPFALTAISSTLADGTGSGQADKIFSDQRILAASATEDLDLAGSLVDALGATITFVKLKMVVIKQYQRRGPVASGCERRSAVWSGQRLNRDQAWRLLHLARPR